MVSHRHASSRWLSLWAILDAIHKYLLAVYSLCSHVTAQKSGPGSPELFIVDSTQIIPIVFYGLHQKSHGLTNIFDGKTTMKFIGFQQVSALGKRQIPSLENVMLHGEICGILTTWRFVVRFLSGQFNPKPRNHIYIHIYIYILGNIYLSVVYPSSLIYNLIYHVPFILSPPRIFQICPWIQHLAYFFFADHFNCLRWSIILLWKMPVSSTLINIS